MTETIEMPENETEVPAPPTLPPLEERPLVTFAVFAYNQEDYIREAVEGAFSQTYQPLEIILSDDCSTDRTFEIMQEMVEAYEGPHEVRVRRNEVNLGVAAHFSKVVELANGEIVIVAAGDDISLSYRTDYLVTVMSDNIQYAMVESSKIDFENGLKPTVPSLNDTECKHIRFSIEDYIRGAAPTLCGATRAIRKRFFTAYGPLSADCPTEDTTSIVRLLMIADGALLTHPLVYRRIHRNNLSTIYNERGVAYDNILNQYLSDISISLSNGTISKEQASLICKWAKNTIIMRDRAHRAKNRQYNTKRMANDLFYTNLTLKNKWNIIKIWIKMSLLPALR